MEILRDISVNLAAAFLGFLIGYCLQKAHKSLRTKCARAFWKKFTTGQSKVVVGCFTEFSFFEGSGLLGVGDAMGLAELQAYFRSLGLEEMPVEYDNRVAGDDLKSNLILLGGPDANSITKEVSERLETSIGFGEPSLHNISIYDAKYNRQYLPCRKTKSGEIKDDYGVIYVASNPFDKSKQVIVIAGSFGFGTWAGVRYAISKDFLNNSLVKNGCYIECLVKTDVILGTPQAIKLITIRNLQESEEHNKSIEDNSVWQRRN